MKSTGSLRLTFVSAAFHDHLTLQFENVRSYSAQHETHEVLKSVVAKRPEFSRYPAAIPLAIAPFLQSYHAPERNIYQEGIVKEGWDFEYHFTLVLITGRPVGIADVGG